MKFAEGGRSAQTCLLVHFYASAYEVTKYTIAAPPCGLLYRVK